MAAHSCGGGGGPAPRAEAEATREEGYHPELCQQLKEAKDEDREEGEALLATSSTAEEGELLLKPEVARLDSDASTELASEDSSFCGLALQALFLVDWDDTILPTSWLNKEGIMDGTSSFSDSQAATLQSVATAAIGLLQALSEQGHVVIITNAGEGWVQQSCLRFLPALAATMRELSLPIVSARSAYGEPLGVACPTEWKRRAFAVEIGAHFRRIPPEAGLSVVALGDAEHERLALLRAVDAMREGDPCSAFYSKSLKFAEHPTPAQLIEEHALVAGAVEEVASYEGDLDIDMPTTMA